MPHTKHDSTPINLEAIYSRALMLIRGIARVEAKGKSLVRVWLADDAGRAGAYVEAISFAGVTMIALTEALKQRGAETAGLRAEIGALEAGVKAIRDAHEDGNDDRVAALLSTWGRTLGATGRPA